MAAPPALCCKDNHSSIICMSFSPLYHGVLFSSLRSNCVFPSPRAASGACPVLNFMATVATWFLPFVMPPSQAVEMMTFANALVGTEYSVLVCTTGSFLWLLAAYFENLMLNIAKQPSLSKTLDNFNLIPWAAKFSRMPAHLLDEGRPSQLLEDGFLFTTAAAQQHGRPLPTHEPDIVYR
ncbi:hypothetical protein B0I35DRAFT_227741 [Stachybotrys elegans]|uniref:Uncharacterized protein n=1 Tax=Stachybotrys elegans TaxID=80388 RepID=A0A8K0WRL1_9HYPO|nr:hypothetical protein B0I35DRAFT_227741 [Stachybotrys elegans]